MEFLSNQQKYPDKCFKKSLKPESVNQRRTENTMANEKGKKDKQSSIKHYT